MEGRLKLKTLKGIGFSAFAKLAVFALSMLTGIILAQTLSAKDYGVVGFAMIFIGFLANFSDLGLNSAVVQRDKLDDDAFATAFTMRLILGVCAFAVLLSLLPLMSFFSDDRAVPDVMKALSLSLLINTAAFIPTAVLTRKMDFGKLMFPQVASSAAGSVVSITLALNGYRYWSLVGSSLCSAAVTAVLVNLLCPVGIRFRFDKPAAREYLSFGSPIFLTGLLVYLIFNADNFIIGAVKGSKDLGYYAIAFTWGSMIAARLYEVVHNVLFPAFSKIKDDREKLKRAYLKGLEFAAFIGVAVNLSLLISAREFLYQVLGHGSDKWMPALLTFKILLIYGMIRSFLEPVANVLLALGETKLMLKSNLLAGILEMAFLYPALKYFGIEGVAIAVTLAYSSQYLVYFPFLRKEIRLCAHDILALVKPMAGSALVAAAFLSVLRTVTDASIPAMLLELAACIAAYLLTYNIITGWSLAKEFASIIGNRVTRRTP
ncbi:MAG TPA: lipopolysaccharide biosynthesis protein [Dissulfurispiraceae bacterium]